MVRTVFALTLLISALNGFTQPMLMLDQPKSVIRYNMQEYELFYRDKNYVEYTYNDTTIAYEFVNNRSTAAYMTIPTVAVEKYLQQRIGKNWTQVSDSTYLYYCGFYPKPVQVLRIANCESTTFEFKLWSSASHDK